MGQATQEASRPKRIRYRETPLQSVLFFALLAVGMSAWTLALDIWTLTGETPSALTLDWWGPWVIGLFVALIMGRYSGVTLMPTAAIVHNLRRRTIQWSNVQGIRVERSQGTRRVVIYEAGGRRTRLRAPFTGFLYWDRGFEEKFHSIGNWWLDHRGPDWVPPPWVQWAQWAGPPAPDGNPYAPPA